LQAPLPLVGQASATCTYLVPTSASLYRTSAVAYDVLQLSALFLHVVLLFLACAVLLLAAGWNAIASVRLSAWPAALFLRLQTIQVQCQAALSLFREVVQGFAVRQRLTACLQGMVASPQSMHKGCLDCDCQGLWYCEKQGVCTTLP
jgi:hypothetical protein